MIAASTVGINFEDQIVGGEGLYSIEQQSSRIRAVREVADRVDGAGIPFFINARTDIFLKILPAPDTEELVEAGRRARQELMPKPEPADFSLPVCATRN